MTDRVLSATQSNTTKVDESVLLKIPKHGKAIETVPPVSIPTLLHTTASKFPNHPALYWKNTLGKWQHFTYSEYEQEVRTCAKAFLSLGLERWHSVCTLGFNSPEWIISSLAAIYAGGLSVGIYTTNSSAACYHCMSLGKANIVVVQDKKQLEKIQQIRDKLPLLKAVVQYEGESSDPSVLSWTELMEIGKSQTDDQLNNVLQQLAVNQCCILVFTSGTIGQPKAVMLSHDNVTWSALAISERVNLGQACTRSVSFLPLSHVAAQILDIYIAITVATTVYIADKDALKGTLIDTLQKVRPTYFLGVPRVWEKIYEKMSAVASKRGYLAKTIASWAKYHGLQHNIRKMNGLHCETWGYVIARYLILKRIKMALGFDRCVLFASGAAPLSPAMKKYFFSIDIPILDIYGMSEAAGANNLSVPNFFNFESVGSTIPGTKTKIWDADKNSIGEICMYGRHIFMGYLDEPEKTAEAIDDEGWLHSGDVGYIDERGLLYVTGRIKELLITSGGENVAPVPIEEKVKLELPCISNVLLIGDKRKFLSALLTLKTEVDENGVPQDNLTADVQNWLNSLGCPASTVTEVIRSGPNTHLLRAVQKGIDRVNEQATSNAQRIQKFSFLPTDFSIVTGELGPTMKLRRNVVISKYSHIIDDMYV